MARDKPTVSVSEGSIAEKRSTPQQPLPTSAKWRLSREREMPEAKKKRKKDKRRARRAQEALQNGDSDVTKGSASDLKGNEGPLKVSRSRADRPSDQVEVGVTGGDGGDVADLEGKKKKKSGKKRRRSEELGADCDGKGEEDDGTKKRKKKRKHSSVSGNDVDSNSEGGKNDARCRVEDKKGAEDGVATVKERKRKEKKKRVVSFDEKVVNMKDKVAAKGKTVNKVMKAETSGGQVSDDGGKNVWAAALQQRKRVEIGLQPERYDKFNKKEGAVTTIAEDGEVVDEGRIGQKARAKGGNKEDDIRMDRTLFVGNLCKTATPKEIRKLFSPFGDIESVRIRGVTPENPLLPKRTALLTGKFAPFADSHHAYVVFKEEQDFDDKMAKAIKELNMSIFMDQHIRVRHGVNKRESRKSSLFIGNLPFDCKEEEVVLAFKEVADKVGVDVVNVRVNRDQDTGVGRGIGFVSFNDSLALQACMNEAGNIKIRGRAVRMEQASKLKKVNAHEYKRNKRAEQGSRSAKFWQEETRKKQSWKYKSKR